MLHAVLFFHVILAARWSLLPIMTLMITRSFTASVQLAGQFCGWSLLVLVADTAVFFNCDSYHTSSRGFRLLAQSFIVAACVFVPGLTAVLLSRATLVGHYLAAVFASSVVALIGFAWCRHSRFHVGPALYRGWAIGEAICACSVGAGLRFATSTLLFDPRQGGIDQRWRWLWTAVTINYIIGWLGLVVGVCAASCTRLYPMHRLSQETGQTHVGVELVDVRCGKDDDRPIPVSQVGVEEGVPLQHSLSTIAKVFRIAVVMYVLWLVAGTSGFLWYQLAPPGETFTSSTLLPEGLCSGCYCAPEYPNSSVVVERDIVYDLENNTLGTQQEQLKFDLYYSSALDRLRLAPAVILIHGGNFMYGSRDLDEMKEEGIYFAQVGFRAFSVDYRLEARNVLAEVGAIRDAVKDVKAAVRFIVKHAETYRVDQDRILAWGQSAGAITAASLNYVPDISTAALYGYPSNVTAAVGISGCVWPFLMDTDFARTPTPWLNVHGDADVVVMPFLAAVTHTVMRSFGATAVQNRLAWIPGGLHVPWGQNARKEKGPDARDFMRPRILAFLVQVMQLDGHTCPSRDEGEVVD